MHTQGVRQPQQVRKLHLRTGLHPLNSRPVDVGRAGETLLGHVQPQSSNSDAVADSPAGVEDPLRLIGWHAINRLRIMVPCQQQI